MQAIDLGALLSGQRQQPQEQAVTMPLEIQVHRLKDAFERFTRKPMPFEVGDLVTPAPDAWLEGSGRPHMVIAVDHDASWCKERGTPTIRCDIRVISVESMRKGDGIAAYWTESSQLLPYTGPGA